MAIAVERNLIAGSDYHRQELVALSRQIAQCAAASLNDRKEAEQDAFELMCNPGIVAERLEWLIDGNYGYGAMVRAREIAKAKRGNRAAQAMQLLAALECGCPQGHAIKAWKRLSREQREALDFRVLMVLDDFRANKEGE